MGIKIKTKIQMKNFIAASILAASALAGQNQQIEHIWRTSPLWHESSDCANDEPEWECLMRPLLLASAAAVVRIENEWTAEKRKQLIDLNIQLEVAMRALYACEISALRTYTSESTAYPASWTTWLFEEEDCVHKYNASVAMVCIEEVAPVYY